MTDGLDPASPHPAERLRPPEDMAAPDPRLHVPDGEELASRQRQHAAVAGLLLNPSVPEAVVIQFETAKNLYLYAWHVYRFYPVAEMQALAALEFGLRERLSPDLPDKRPALSRLLRLACDRHLIRNDGFQRWHQLAEQRARERFRFEQFQRMQYEGLTELAWDDDAPVEITPADRDWDLTDVLQRSLPSRRNLHAHGGPTLTPQVRGKLELVMEILNQLYPMPAQP